MFIDDRLLQQLLRSFGHLQPPHYVDQLLHRSEVFDLLPQSVHVIFLLLETLFAISANTFEFLIILQ
jgi:hypothetical protein